MPIGAAGGRRKPYSPLENMVNLQHDLAKAAGGETQNWRKENNFRSRSCTAFQRNSGRRNGSLLAAKLGGAAYVWPCGWRGWNGERQRRGGLLARAYGVAAAAAARLPYRLLLLLKQLWAKTKAGWRWLLAGGDACSDLMPERSNVTMFDFDKLRGCVIWHVFLLFIMVCVRVLCVVVCQPASHDDGEYWNSSGCVCMCVGVCQLNSSLLYDEVSEAYSEEAFYV